MGKFDIKQKIKNMGAKLTGKVVGKKMSSETKKSFLKGLLSRGKHDIDSFTISIKNIQPKDVFLSTPFLENMIEAIKKVKKPSGFKRYIGSYKKIFDMWEKTKENLIENFVILKKCIESNADVNKQIDEFWENNKAILSDMNAAQERSSNLDNNKNQLDQVNTELDSLIQKKLELEKQLKTETEKYEKAKKDAEDKKNELQKKMLDLYIEEKKTLEEERDTLKQEIEQLPADLTELNLKDNKKSYEALRTNLTSEKILELADQRDKALKSLNVLEEKYESEDKKVAEEAKPLLVVKALTENTVPKPKSTGPTTPEKLPGLTDVERSIAIVKEFVNQYNTIMPTESWLNKALRNIQKNHTFTPDGYTDKELVQFYDWVEGALRVDSDEKAKQSWVGIKSFWMSAMYSNPTKGTNQQDDLKMLTILSLSPEQWKMITEGKLTKMKKTASNSIPAEVYENITDPKTGNMKIDLHAILEYIARQYDKLKALDKIKITDDKKTYGVLSALFSANTLAASMDGYADAKKAWDNVNEYCYELAMKSLSDERSRYTQAEMIMRLLTGEEVDESVKSEIENVNKYVISYNSAANKLMNEKHDKKSRLENDYMISYPALTDVSHSNYGKLKPGTRLYHIAKIYLGLIHPIDEGYSKRKSGLFESLKEIEFDYPEKDIELMLNFIETKRENTLDQTLKEKNKTLKDCTEQIESLTKESETLDKEIKLTVAPEEILKLRDQMHTRIVAVKGSVLTVLMTLSKIIKVLYPLYEQCKAVLNSQGQPVPDQVKPDKHEFKSVMTVLDFVCHLHGYIDALLDNQQEINYDKIIIEKPKSYKKVIEVLQSTLKYNTEIYEYYAINN